MVADGAGERACKEGEPEHDDRGELEQCDGAGEDRGAAPGTDELEGLGGIHGSD